MNAITQLINLPEGVLEALVVFAVLVGVLAFLYSILSLRRQQHTIKQLYSKVGELQRNSSVLVSGSLGMGQRILELEKKFAALDEKQSGYNPGELDFSYSQAHNLIEQGIDANTISMNTGLSQSEVELMELLHKTTRKPLYE